MAARNREPNLPSSHTIIQYFTSFMDDPLFDCIEGDGPYAKAKQSYENKEYDKIITFCDEEVTANGPYALKAKLLKATFLVLTKQLDEALKLLSAVSEEGCFVHPKVSRPNPGCKHELCRFQFGS